MGAKVRTLLGLLCLLLAPTGALSEGEICLDWLPGPVEDLLPFRCPQRPDGSDGHFCCGTCIEPYCCDSEEDHLDQDECLEIWMMLNFVINTMLAKRTRVTHPTSDSQTPGVNSAWSPSKTELTGAVLSMIACAVIAFLNLSFILYKCCPRKEYYEICRRIVRGADTWPPSSWQMPYPIPPIEKPMTALLRATEQSLSNLSAASCAMDGSTAGPRTRRRAHTVRAPEEASTRAPPNSGVTSDAAATGEVTPELGAADGGEISPVQGASGGGEAASPLVSLAPGQIST